MPLAMAEIHDSQVLCSVKQKEIKMTTYTITLSDAEDKALKFVAISAQDWIDNAVHDRCRIAIDEIVNTEVQRKLAANEPITGSKEDIVNAADIETAAERQIRLEASQII
jgi:hypothetical protein